MKIPLKNENNPTFNRLRWQCRRGMLELDLYLMRYLEQKYANASSDEQALFEILLSEPDPILLEWFTGRLVPQDDKMAQLVCSIRA